MTLVPTTAASAVYHDALTTARGFRRLCVLVLLLVLVGQLALFFTAKYWEGFPGRESAGGEITLTTGVGTEIDRELEVDDGVFETEPDVDLTAEQTSVDAQTVTGGLYMAVYATLWLGLVFSMLLSLTLAFTTLVMLCGRTVGVSRVARAFLWSLLLVLLLVPWQAVLSHPTVAGGPFHVPGVLFTWPELLRNVPSFVGAEWLGWVRFVGWPVVALILLLIVAVGSGGGIKQALGEDLPDADDDDAAVRPAT
jgi:hypothetical protein